MQKKKKSLSIALHESTLARNEMSLVKGYEPFILLYQQGKTFK